MDPVLAAMRKALAERYTVEHELGRGGMAIVYRAVDVRLRRPVAIKVLRQDVGGTDAVDRFLREIETVAQLQHPHIVPLFEAGRAGEHPFFVMPYIEGESLRQRLEREGPLPLEVAVRVALDVADALAFAHERGVVHRDVKPENIMLSAGHAAVADFGIARALNAAGLGQTETGLAVGTPPYMSPEQATADRRLDGRSDQYALGCVLYEMLTGQPPFTGATSQAILARHVADPVPPIGTVRQVPIPLEEALMRALSKAAADRYPTARALREALEEAMPRRTSEQAVPTREPTPVPAPAPTLSPTPSPTLVPRSRAAVVAAAAVAVIGGALAYWFGVRGPRSLADSMEALPSIAVLPMTFSGAPEDSMLAVGLHEQLLQSLARIKGIRTPGAGRVAVYRDSVVDPTVIGARLGVSTVLTGRLYVSGTTMRIIPELLRVADGAVIWTDPVQGEFQRGDTLVDWFAIQEQVARGVVAKLLPTLDPQGLARVARGGRTGSAEALRLYSEALRQGYGSEGSRRAIALLDSAVRIDSTFADAWAAMAIRIGAAENSRVGPTERAIRHRRAFVRALHFDPENASALAEQGWYAAAYEWNWEESLSALRKVVEQNPSAPDPSMNLALVFAFISELDSAVYHAERAASLDPASPFVWNILGKIYAFRREGARAIEASEKSLALDSTMWHTNWVLMNEYLNAGRRAEAEVAAQRLRRHGVEYVGSLGLYAGYLARQGDRETARFLLDSLRDSRTEGPFGDFELGNILLAAGDSVAALSALEQAVNAHVFEVYSQMSLNFAGFRGRQKFEALRARVFGDREMLIGPYIHPPGFSVSTASPRGRRPRG